jgi:hypothetical protein
MRVPDDWTHFIEEFESRARALGFEPASRERSGSFGNEQVTLRSPRSPARGLRLSRDRGSASVSLNPAHSDLWFDLELLARRLDPDREEEFDTLESAATFLESALPAIEELFEPASLDQTATDLRMIARRTMHERYGRPL